MKYDFITVGGATEDISMYTSEGLVIENKKDILRQKLLAFEYGAKISATKGFSTFGGGAANTAVNFAGLGFRAATIAAVGDDMRGKAILDNLKKRKVDTSLMQKVHKQESGFSCLIVAHGNEHTIFTYRAANDKLRIGDKEVNQIKNSQWTYVTSLSGKWQEDLKKVFKAGNKIAWNPGNAQLKQGYKKLSFFLKHVTVLTINKDEAIELVLSDPEYRDKNNRFLNDIKNLLVVIKSWGPEVVVITNGQQGAYAYDGKKFYYQPIIKERARKDTTGVGDAFGSTFVAGLEIFQGNIKKAMYAGIKNTASVVAYTGAQNGLLSRSKLVKGIK